jgi:hypothetical protein
LLDTARQQISLHSLPKQISYHQILAGTPLQSIGKFDAIFSWSVFEHVELDLLSGIAADLFESLPSKSSFFLQIEPLYYSPYGSHLGGVIKKPWAHLLMSDEELIQSVRTFDLHHSAEGDKAYRDKTFDVCSLDDFKSHLLREYKSLNKIKYQDLFSVFTNVGFRVYEQWLNKVDLMPPDHLLEKYSLDDLTTNEIRVLFAK